MMFSILQKFNNTLRLYPIIDVNQCIEKRIFFLSHSFINCGHLFLTKTEIFVLLHQEIKFQQCKPQTN